MNLAKNTFLCYTVNRMQKTEVYAKLKTKKILTVAGLVAASVGLVACGQRGNTENSEAKVKATLITGVGGVDDKSFSQSAWEGLESWGKSQGLSEGNGYGYYQSDSESDYTNNFEQAAANGSNLVIGIGFMVKNEVEQAAKDHPEVNYVIIDEVIEGQDNVTSATFADHEAAYLAGVAAAKTTAKKQVGFIGGMESEVVKRFEKGFEAGVHSVDPEIKVQVDYAGSFTDASKGKSLAQAQYAAGADVIYHAAGGSGAGVFKEAKDLNETRDEADKVWVIGVDQDQSAEGDYTSKDGKKANFVLASTIKEVGAALKDIAEKTSEGNFPGNQTTVYGLKVGGVNLVTSQLSSDAKAAVSTAKEDIIAGRISVPQK